MVPQQLDFSSLCDFSWLNKMFLPVEVHGRLLAVLCTVASGPTVVTGQIPTLFVTGAIAAAH